MCAQVTNADVLPLALLWIGGTCLAYGAGGYALAAVGRRRGDDRLRIAGRTAVAGAAATAGLFAGSAVVFAAAAPYDEAVKPVLGPVSAVVALLAIGAPAVPAVLGTGYYVLFEDPWIGRW